MVYIFLKVYTAKLFNKGTLQGLVDLFTDLMAFTIGVRESHLRKSNEYQ